MMSLVVMKDITLKTQVKKTVNLAVANIHFNLFTEVCVGMYEFMDTFITSKRHKSSKTTDNVWPIKGTFISQSV